LLKPARNDLDLPQVFEIIQLVPPFDLFADPPVPACFFYPPPIPFDRLKQEVFIHEILLYMNTDNEGSVELPVQVEYPGVENRKT
jgi:hypothetical protein